MSVPANVVAASHQMNMSAINAKWEYAIHEWYNGKMKRINQTCCIENLGHGEAHKVANFMWKHLPQVEALLVIEKDGRPIEVRVSAQFEHVYECKWLKSLAALVSIRYPISNFHKQLNGLEMTVNIFKEKIVIVKSINTFQLLIVIIPKSSDLIKAIGVLSNEQKWHKS